MESSIRTYRDLKIWQKARLLVGEVYSVSKKLPKEELYGLISQIRRAVVSVPSNIAEGHARQSTKEFINFLSITSGSLAEVETQLLVAIDLGYLSEQDIAESLSKIMEIEKMLFSLKKSLREKIKSKTP